MKTFQQFVSLAAALLMGLALVGCGGAETKADEVPAAEPAAETPADEAAEAPVEEKSLEKFEGNKMERAEEDE